MHTWKNIGAKVKPPWGWDDQFEGEKDEGVCKRTAVDGEIRWENWGDWVKWDWRKGMEGNEMDEMQMRERGWKRLDAWKELGKGQKTKDKEQGTRGEGQGAKGKGQVVVSP